MTARVPSRRLLQQPAGLQCLHQPSYLPIQARRSLFNMFGNRDNKKPSGPSGAITNPVLDEYMKRKPSAANQSIIRGDLASSSIFDADRQVQEREEEKRAVEEGVSEDTKIGGIARNPSSMAAVLDPQPIARQRWERKMVIRDIKKGNRLNDPLFIKRTERESASRSHNFKTSTKKLGMLARQIAGKTVEDAIVQMRYSKKKAAKDVLDYLEFARDEAIVKRGMGLGRVNSSANAANLNQTGDAMVAADLPRTKTSRPVEIQLKDGKRRTVTDMTNMYIDQAWIGRGPYGKAPDYRAKGKVNIMHTPWTSLSLVLKEEATRVREFEQREEKRRRQRENKVWHPLPDRPIVGQRQWFSW